MILCRVLTVSRPLLAPNRLSHFPSAPHFSELSPVFAATSETSKKHTKSDLLTPFFSSSLVHIFSIFSLLKKQTSHLQRLHKIGGRVPPCAQNWAFPFWNPRSRTCAAVPLSPPALLCLRPSVAQASGCVATRTDRGGAYTAHRLKPVPLSEWRAERRRSTRRTRAQTGLSAPQQRKQRK